MSSPLTLSTSTSHPDPRRSTEAGFHPAIQFSSVHTVHLGTGSSLRACLSTGDCTITWWEGYAPDRYSHDSYIISVKSQQCNSVYSSKKFPRETTFLVANMALKTKNLSLVLHNAIEKKAIPDKSDTPWNVCFTCFYPWYTVFRSTSCPRPTTWSSLLSYKPTELQEEEN